MFPRLPIPPIQPFSFFVGFFAGIILVFLLSRVRPLLGQIRANLREGRAAAKVRGSVTFEDHHRRQVLRSAQGQHLAANLFSLDEILQPVRLIAPPPVIEPGGAIPLDDVVSQTVPYMPAWPEMAATYNAMALTLPEALSGGSNLAILGQPGSGKTVALAHLASLAANRDGSLGNLSEFVPILLHVADLDLPLKNPNDLLTPIVDALAQRTPMLHQPRLPGFIEHAFKSQGALLLLDGLDELHREGIHEAVSFVELILKHFPATRIVAAASPEYVGGLIELGFAPLTLMPWNDPQQSAFVETWTRLWDQYVAVEAWTQSGPGQVDPILLNEWLGRENPGYTPLEFTLKVWGAYAGDSRGPLPADAIDTHVRRLSADVPLEALQILALQTNVTAQPVFDPRKARDWVKSFEPQEAEAPEAEISEGTGPEPEAQEKEKAKKDNKSRARAEMPPPAAPGLLSKLAASGLLVSHRANRMRFAHPSLAGYLAGRGMAVYGASALVNQPAWSGKTATLNYAAIYGNAAPQAQSLLNSSKPPLRRELLSVARWLREAPRQAQWRGPVFAALTNLIRDETATLSLRGQAVTAMVLSGDPGITTLFRQLLQSSASPHVLQLAALGSGMARDAKAVPLLASLLDNPNPLVRRAGVLGLVAIGSREAVDTAGSILLSGDEDLRRAAAEALANHPAEGHEMLREGSEVEDILVRRSVVYGLGRVHQEWADALVSALQTEDEQWVVRAAAAEVMDSRGRTNPRVPRALPPAHESPWLIEFAAKLGMGISPGQDPTDLLLAAFRSEVPEEQVAALQYLRRTPTAGVINAFYQAIYSSDIELRELAFQAVQEVALDGIKIPDPLEFGLG
ncbi:MAG: HEAT repeat domain-containing protein [Chloroflexota bacterium]